MTTRTTAPGPAAAERPDPDVPAACCAATVQETCCEPGDKAGCCGAEQTAGGSCGCQ